MAKPMVTATDRLANVMDVVALGRRTGLLRVERGSGTMRQEGEVYFVNGHPVYAAVINLRGQDALGMLTRWAECWFSFDPQAAQPIPNISGVLPAVGSGAQGGFSSSRPNNSGGYAGPAGPYGADSYTGSTGPNAYGNANSRPGAAYNGAGYNGGTSGLHPGGADFGGNIFGGNNGSGNGYSNNNLGGNGAGYNPHAHPMQPQQPVTPPGFASGPLSNAGWGASGGGESSGPRSGVFGSSFGSSGGQPNTRPDAQQNSGASWGNGSSPAQPAYPTPFAPDTPTASDPGAQARLQRRPRRAPDVRDLINVVTTYNLSRAHRTVLLLADGEHSVQDLSRLSGKSVDEVASLLRDLEGRGLVYYYQ